MNQYIIAILRVCGEMIYFGETSANTHLGITIPKYKPCLIN